MIAMYLLCKIQAEESQKIDSAYITAAWKLRYRLINTNMVFNYTFCDFNSAYKPHIMHF